MADILPFRAVRYDAAAVGGDLADVAAPPYDVISTQEQNALYAKHPNNVIRLILGREEDKYTQANALFHQWLTDGVLIADPAPSVYVYHQCFTDPITGQALPERIGIVCLLKLEDYASGKVLPHENTLTAAKADRLDLLRATNAQFESIYGLYSDPDRSVESFLSEYDDREPIMEEVDGLIGSSHRIERVSDENAIETLRSLLEDKPIFIADGHHRYETSLNYRREARSNPEFASAADGALAADYILITLTAFEDEGLLVLPTHRLVRNADAQVLENLPMALANQFTVTPLEPKALDAAIVTQSHNGKTAFGLVLPGDRGYLAVLNGTASEAAAAISGPTSEATKKLDVTLLHTLVLEAHLGINSAALASGEQVTYTRDAAEAIAKVQAGDVQAAFILGRPSVTEVRDVSLAGDRMPQKSTFFYPKLLSGLLMRDLSLDNPLEALDSDA